MIPSTGRRTTLLSLLALHAMLSLCGPGHHALDAFGTPGESCGRLDAETAAIEQGDGGCVVCDVLSLSALPLTITEAAMGDDVVARPVLQVDTASRRTIVLPATPPRAPPAHSI